VTPEDVVAIHDIYRPIVEETAISFELEPPSVEEMRGRIAGITATHPWLVLEIDGEVGGYAYASPFRDRPAYRWSVETTIYLSDEIRGRGMGKVLYTSLLDRVTDAGFANAYAGVALPNPGSEALHLSVGFRPIGVFPRAGFKLGEWHDVGWWHRPLHQDLAPEDPLPPPSTF
jgi:phosphinothricin acetyltransferase